ncbi:hypothetical protein ACJ41O_010040 [Fusarium nematophilum]
MTDGDSKALGSESKRVKQEMATLPRTPTGRRKRCRETKHEHPDPDDNLFGSSPSSSMGTSPTPPPSFRITPSRNQRYPGYIDYSRFEPLSVEALALEQFRSGYITNPLAWLLHDTQLLGCYFLSEHASRQLPDFGSWDTYGPAPTGTVLDNVPRNSPLWSSVQTLVDAAVMAVEYLTGPSALWLSFPESEADLLAPFGLLPDGSPPLQFRYSNDIRTMLDIPLVFFHNSSPMRLPKVAYLDMDMVKSCRRYWAQGGELYEAVKPEDAFQDPYIMGVLIALAQKQKQIIDTLQPGVQPSALLGPRAFRVYAVATAQCDGALHAYRANISEDFLNKLDPPSRFSVSRPVTVAHYRIVDQDPRQVLQELGEVLCLPLDSRAV